LTAGLRTALVLALLLALPAAAQPLKDWTGGAAPALELEDAAGKLHRLADYSGSVVLVNFWATWCEPCREEMPSMEALRTQLAGRPFVILAVNVGEGARATRAFGEKMRLNFPLLVDRDTKTTRSWGARILPASFVIGTDGAIRYSHLGALDWQAPEVKSAIERLLP
jgi:peroxiredoxin